MSAHALRDYADPADLRQHLTEAHGLPELIRQDMSDPECQDFHEECHQSDRRKIIRAVDA